MPSEMSTHKRTIVTALVLISTFFNLASQTMMVTALPVIQHTLHVSLTSAQWLTTGYMLLIGIVTPLSSNLYDKYTNRQVFLTTTAVFILGTLLGSFATNFGMLLTARLLQACAGGILMSFQMTTMVTIYPAEKRGTVLGMSGLVIASGPAIGPTIAGLILNYFDWHYLFTLILPFIILIWLIAYFVFPNYSKRRAVRIDLLSVLLSLAGSSLTLASLTVFQQSFMFGLIMLIAGLGFLTIFTRRQFSLTEPMLRVSLLKLRSFRMLTFIGVFAFMVLIGTEQIIPIFVENIAGLSSMHAGLILLPGAVANALFAALAGRYYDTHGPKVLISTGIFLMLLATIPFITISVQTPIWLITCAYMLRMIGNALVFSPAMSEAFKDVALPHISHATALNNTFRQVAASVSVTLMIVIADSPSSFVTGTRLAIWFTVLILIIMGTLFHSYLKYPAKK
ncbi:MFS transporter [Liquorilactobacillus capillatus]|uniref:Multidrug resistance protein B n=1 Tax=Liquorilactobacillus capillatus DSM 19910 TaxID=1423731 RepID=A0A0R1M2B0_9LACO|nr:MFS transporter [Liquorilactobacillus capillatus]KRL02156.1 multidrug resistance protein B [Liquorilactobacillus capillatus DSM 19910]